MISRFSVVVIGGGPAGLSAAIAASVDGASVLLVERETRLGGILKQCIHDGFGIVRHNERLTGPEYAFMDISTLEQTNTRVLLNTFVSRIVRSGNGYQLTLCNRHGLLIIETNSIVLATGCRERTAGQAGIHGIRTSGVMTAGNAQYYLNVLGQLPAKRSIILGSGDVGLIVARRLTLEGTRVLGVYEAKQKPGGQLKNVTQCIYDFDIPLHFGHTVTRVAGTPRLKTVEICRVDKNLNPIRGSENLVKCDSLILSVGLIPENELADDLGIPIDENTNGPVCDQNYMTLVDGIFSCGNSLHVNDIVDNVSESGETAGRNAARYIPRERRLVNISASKDFLYIVPHCLDIDMLHGDTIMYFRIRETRENAIVRILVDGHEIFSKQFEYLRPQEMGRIAVNFNTVLSPESKIEIRAGV